MAYIGKTPVIGNFVKLDSITVVNGQAAYTMQNGGVNFTSYDNVNQFLVSLNGVLQAPTDSFTVSGSTLTFASNLSTGDVIDFVLVLGNSLDIGTPSDNTVSLAKINDTAKTFFTRDFRNIIINGDMSIAQRATSATTLGHAQYNTVDRWSQNLTASTMTFTGEQSTDAPSGFDYSYKISCTTAEASLAASSRLMPYYRVEDSNLGYLKFGSSSAVDLTMSFYVKSNKTGTYQINLWHNNVSGYISATYTINSASTWEKKEITFKGDQGTAMGNDAGVGLQLEFVLAGGSNYTGGTFIPNTTTTYPSYVANTRATSQGVNLADSTSNTWQITGLQLEVGSTASDFEFLPYDVNLQRCERYYQSHVFKGGTVITLGNSFSLTSAAGFFHFNKMRSAPSVTLPSAGQSSGTISYLTDGGAYPSSTGNNNPNTISNNNFKIDGSSYSGLSSNSVSWLYPNGDATIKLDSEL